MIADGHLVGPALRRSLVQQGCQFGNRCRRTHLGLRRCDVEILVAEHPVVLDRLFQVVRGQRLQLQVHAAALQAVAIQQLAQFRRRVFLVNLGRAAVAPELDSLVAELAEGFERARHIALEFPAHRVELEANRDWLSLTGSKGN